MLTVVGEMPWKAFPFEDSRAEHLSQMYAGVVCFAKVALSRYASLSAECKLLSSADATCVSATGLRFVPVGMLSVAYQHW